MTLPQMVRDICYITLFIHFVSAIILIKSRTFSSCKFSCDPSDESGKHDAYSAVGSRGWMKSML